MKRAFYARLCVLAVALPAIAAAGASGPERLSTEEMRFLRQHWKRPLLPQGRLPSSFSQVEASLDPQDCGTCHPVQHADWKTSLHGRSMGPGLTGQLVDMWQDDPQTAQQCLGCHAPLAEQSPVLQRPSGTLAANPAFDAGLQRQGLVCAACHVREHRRYGPPPRGDRGRQSGRRPHEGATAATAFTRSAFCASCHQFEPDGFALNGKLLENTYEEWKASPAAARDVTCQGCHMPGRRHLWRGIHDPEMVRQGLTITLTTDRARYAVGETLSARLVIENTGVGHYFPTYVTPRVVARLVVADAMGHPLAGTREERVIAREVSLDLSREVADTRIAPGGRFVFEYRRPLPKPHLRLQALVTVEPDAFYTRFFESRLEAGAGAGAADLREALESTRRSAFNIFRKELPLTW
jgi:hypothetical protein